MSALPKLECPKACHTVCLTRTASEPSDTSEQIRTDTLYPHSLLDASNQTFHSSFKFFVNLCQNYNIGMEQCANFLQSKLSLSRQFAFFSQALCFRSRNGEGSKTRFFATSVAGPDAASTFTFAGLVLLTDAGVYYQRAKATGEAI